MKAYSALVNQALGFAARAHHGQSRKGTDIPYIQHPMCVALILDRHGFPEHLVVAGLLHDVVEDCDVPLADIEARFGPQVARLVDAVSEVKQDPGSSATRPWRTRKEESLLHLRRGGHEVAALKAADALHNGRATLADLEAHGAAAWGRFRAGPAEQRWYYESLAALVQGQLGEHPLAKELHEVVQELARHASAAVAQAGQ